MEKVKGKVLAAFFSGNLGEISSLIVAVVCKINHLSKLELANIKLFNCRGN